MSDDVLDYLVIGAGPGGLQLGALLRSGDHRFQILEEGQVPGTFFTTFPRHRTLISSNKRYTGTDDPELNLRMDWNSLLCDDPALRFTRYSERYFPAADDMVRYLADFAAANRLPIRYGTRVTRIGRDADGVFAATGQDGTVFRARRVVMATGVSRPYLPDVPGIEAVERYTTVSVDPKDFVDQRVLILGKGNSAFETADNLIETAAVIHVAGPGSLRLAWQTHFVGHLRAVNNNFLDTYQLKSQNAILDGSVRSIEPVDGGYRVAFAFSRADELVKHLWYDRVIACTGFRLDTSVFAEDCLPRLVHNDRFAELSPAYESVTVPGLYFAGTLMQQRDFKRSTSGFIHGFRYGVRALYHILEQRHHDRPWPAREVPADPVAITDAVLARVNRTSALWQQFGVLGDLVALSPDGPARYLEEVPVDHAAQGAFGADYLIVTLEYGPDHDKVDPFDISVRRAAQDSVAGAYDASYLHPVVRRYRDGRLVAVHHLAENLENEWDRPTVHRDPLRAFLAAQLADRLATSGR